MTYFYNSHTGGFANESPPSPQYLTYETQLHLGQGWHAYGSLQAMMADIQRNHWPHPDASKGALSSLGTSTVPGTAKQALDKAANLTGLPAIGDFFNRLTQANTWIRVGEVVAGLLLLYVGVTALFRNTAAGDAAKSVKNTVKKGAEFVPK